jgi:hypothetical protein
MVVGDGLQRTELSKLQTAGRNGMTLTHIPYCSEGRAARCFLSRSGPLSCIQGCRRPLVSSPLEAQSCGTPVIGIRGSYMDRIIHNDQELWAQENTGQGAGRSDRRDATCQPEGRRPRPPPSCRRAIFVGADLCPAVHPLLRGDRRRSAIASSRVFPFGRQQLKV